MVNYTKYTFPKSSLIKAVINVLKGNNQKISIKTPVPYHGPSITTRVQDDVLENTLRRFTVFAPTV